MALVTGTESRPGRTAAAAVAAASLVGVLAGCGSSSSGAAPSPAKAVETAYTSTLAARTAHFRFSESTQMPSSAGAASQQVVNGSGTVNFASKAVTMSMTGPAGTAAQLVLIGPNMFLQVPAADRSQIPGGKQWVEINLSQVAQAKLGASYAQLVSGGSNNPAALLGQLQAVSDQVVKAGTTTVAGVATTEYDAALQFSKLEAQAQARGGAKAAQALASEAAALHTSTLPVKVWLDSANRVRQYQTTLPLPASSPGAGPASATMTMTFDAYGVAVNASAPPASEVADVTQKVIGGAGTSSSGS
ncbi:hypothetical protein K6U06_18155 [Acidiferrimicrobium sp. IK]|uniref:hypothetical protein n=1 Tax=Acidiferrimicrobium sp. IK TaxID=2871700 RepID=UPI0021CB3DB6|nr:hypothetical protein [Acidiferrimicrobium sp. IK]MCU4186295.1 hypothetical protein [Acidiferrimicrobium sp. IK]